MSHSALRIAVCLSPALCVLRIHDNEEKPNWTKRYYHITYVRLTGIQIRRSHDHTVVTQGL